MKKPNHLSTLLLALGAALLVLAIGISLCCRNVPAAIAGSTKEASQAADDFMNAVCAGDYDAAGSMLYGQPELGLSQDPADAVGVILWDAFVESTSYTKEGSIYAADTGLCQNISFRCLNLFTAADALGQKAQELLPRYVEKTQDLSEVYDENNQYREDFVLKVLADAADIVMEDDALYTQQTIQLNLFHRNGQWWISPDHALLSAISGGISG